MDECSQEEGKTRRGKLIRKWRERRRRRRWKNVYQLRSCSKWSVCVCVLHVQIHQRAHTHTPHATETVYILQLCLQQQRAVLQQRKNAECGKSIACHLNVSVCVCGCLCQKMAMKLWGSVAGGSLLHVSLENRCEIWWKMGYDWTDSGKETVASFCLIKWVYDRDVSFEHFLKN